MPSDILTLLALMGDLHAEQAALLQAQAVALPLGQGRGGWRATSRAWFTSGGNV